MDEVVVISDEKECEKERTSERRKNRGERENRFHAAVDRRFRVVCPCREAKKKKKVVCSFRLR